MRRIKFTSFVIVLSFSGFWLTSCAPEKDEETLKAEARMIHDRVLTVDTHSDTPSLMLRKGWDIGERHEPGQRRSGKIDLPRMAEGGLDAE
ncbi:MAG: membrane dipeptidase, partial [Candidatus Aminicenantes bacterium]|nr:membrane dipeptidase [Candidatus Aminicenantes bacterium]